MLEFAREAARRVVDGRWHPSQASEDLPDGRVRLTFRVGTTPELRRWVLGFSQQVRVVRPEHLAAWVRGEASAMMRCC